MMRSVRKHAEGRASKTASAPWNRRAHLRFGSDAGGAIAVMFALGASILLGAVGYAVDVGLWEAAHRDMQDAADSAVISAIVGAEAGVDVTTQARAVAAGYNFVNGVAGATVTANNPPLSGSHVGDPKYIEVIVSRPQVRYFSVLFGTQPINESARAVAGQTTNACILALDQTMSGAVSTSGNAVANANGCSIYSDSNNPTYSISAGGTSSITAPQVGATYGGGITGNITAGSFPHGAVLPDPYGYVAPPSCGPNQPFNKNDTTMSPGTYPGGVTLNAGANVTMSPGVYCISGGPLTVNGTATLSGAGVTIYFTVASNGKWGTVNFAGGASVNLTALTSGPTAGIVLFGDRNMPVGTGNNIQGGNTQTLSGVIYFQTGAVNYAGGASASNGCTQIVADSVSFVGNSNLSLNCPQFGVAKIGAIAQLVE
jgi:Putative Flp pilus-assembly TadE/G-like